MPEDVGGMGLIPLWDLCNHEGGRCTTEVLFKEGSGVCVHFSAMRDFQEGEAVTMSYGNRSNVELVLYSGFVQRGNMNDVVVVKIGMDDKVEIAAFKARVLGRLGVDVRGVKGNGWEVFVRVGIGKEGISFAVSVARVVVMDKVGMNEMLKSGHALPDREMNRDAELRARGLVVKAMEDKLMQYDEVEKGKVGEEARQLIDELHECDKVLLKTGIVCLKGEEDVLPS